MNLLKKIQNLPVEKRKVIFWFIIIFLTVILFFGYFQYVKKKVKGVNKEEIEKGFQFQELKEGFEKLPQIEMPQVPK